MVVEERRRTEMWMTRAHSFFHFNKRPASSILVSEKVFRDEAIAECSTGTRSFHSSTVRVVGIHPVFSVIFFFLLVSLVCPAQYRSIVERKLRGFVRYSGNNWFEIYPVRSCIVWRICTNFRPASQHVFCGGSRTAGLCHVDFYSARFYTVTDTFKTQLTLKLTQCPGWTRTMTVCGVWAAVMLLLNVLSSMTKANTAIDDKRRSFESEGSLYSWTGPNALARSALVERQEKLQYNCEEILGDKGSGNDDLPPESFRNILVDEQHELLYCYVPKVACTNWKRVLMVATGKWPGNDPLEIPADQAHSSATFQRLSNYTLPEIERMLMTYDKLIVVRHPLERLLSAYRNKLEAKHEKSSKYFQTRFGKKIIRRYRRNATEESLKKGDDVTFREFVEFVTDDSSNETRNEHWKPIYELCHPCLVNYNLVSKYESLVEDATEVLERMGVEYVSFPTKPTNSEPTSKKLEKYYSTLSYEQLRKLANLYKLDLRLFDYSLEDVLGFSLA